MLDVEMPTIVVMQARVSTDTIVQWIRSGTSAAISMAVGHTNERLVMGKLPLVTVVDDNESVRESLPDLLQQVGYTVQAFASAEAFLASNAVDETHCVVLDVGLPGMSGPELQQELMRRGNGVPIVFITAQGDRSLGPRLVALGAVACLFKPFSDDALLEAVERALETK